jgi:hypothetical protein
MKGEDGRNRREENSRKSREEKRRKNKTRRGRDSLVGRQNITRFQSLPNLITPLITPFIS